MSKEQLTLLDLPRDAGVKIKAVYGKRDEPGKEGFITFHHIDGMYSYCTTEEGDVVHLSAMTPLIKENDYYIIGKAE